jgi:hypothetical protein
MVLTTPEDIENAGPAIGACYASAQRSSTEGATFPSHLRQVVDEYLKINPAQINYQSTLAADTPCAGTVDFK